MRRANHLFEQVADRENLRLAVSKALRGKRSNREARVFQANLDAELERLRSGILRNDLPLGEYHQFRIFDPKERLITAPVFRERVLHHAIFNICEPILERWLVADTFACRCGKGRLAALGRAGDFARRFPFFLKLDIRKYFDSVSHTILIHRLKRLAKDRRLLALLSRIIDSYETAPGRGLPIGSLTSQHFANFYLGWFDRYVKETLRVKGYVRYMDDCALWGSTSPELQVQLAQAKEFLKADLGLEVKAHPYLNRTGHGMDFLGCRVFPHFAVPNRRSRVRFRRKLRAVESAYEAGAIGGLTLQQRSTALVAFVRSKGISSWRFRDRVLESESVSDHRLPTG